MLQRFRTAAKPEATAQVGFKVAWAPTEDQGVELAHRLWPTSGLPGELAQILPTPAHFEQASTLVTPESTRSAVTAGNDPARHVQAYAPYLDAGFDEVYVANMGQHYGDMLRMYGDAVLPALRTEELRAHGPRRSLDDGTAGGKMASTEMPSSSQGRTAGSTRPGSFSAVSSGGPSEARLG